MHIQLSNGGGAPIYQQIVSQVKYLVASGRMKPGDEVEPIRRLAQRLVVNPNTVARAYLELERDGVVTKRHGTGTFIAERPPTVSQRQKQKILNDRADALLAEAHQLGLDVEDVIKLVRERSTKLALT